MKSVTVLIASGLLGITLGAAAQQPSSTPQSETQSTPVATPPTPDNDLPPVPAFDQDPNYILGTDDSLVVNVWKEPTLSGPLVIRPDGRISLPLVGDVVAAGLTPMALAASIADNLKKFINDPTVTVTVTAFNSRRVFFIGEVQRPGPVNLSRDMTMLQAISAAGGTTPYANRRKIYVLRTVKTEKVTKGEKVMETKQVKLPFDYKKALRDGNQQNVVLTAGDTIVVP